MTKPQDTTSENKRRKDEPHHEATEVGDPSTRRRAETVEQESFGPGKDSPDPNQITGTTSSSPWARKEPGSKRPY
jgi:hypothetical protein